MNYTLIVNDRGRERLVIMSVEYANRDRDTARKVAYRLVMGRREPDFDELMQKTHFVDCETVSEQAASFLLRMS